MGDTGTDRLIKRVLHPLSAGRFDEAMDLAVGAWGDQGTAEDRAGFCLLLTAGVQAVGDLSPADGLELGLVVAARLGALRVVARALGELGQAMTPEIDAGATVQEAATAVLAPLLVRTPSH